MELGRGHLDGDVDLEGPPGNQWHGYVHHGLRPLCRHGVHAGRRGLDDRPRDTGADSYTAAAIGIGRAVGLADGAEELFVGDASIMPFAPSGFTHLLAIMIAELLLKETSGLKPLVPL